MRKKFDERIPRYTDLIVPTFQALKVLGGSGKNDEILACIIKNLKLSDEVVDFPHKGRPSLSEVSYQLMWARTYLKKYGVIENSSRAVWSILPEYMQKETLDAKLIVQTVVQNSAEQRQIKVEDADVETFAKRVAKSQFAQYGMLSVPEDVLDNYAKDMLKNKQTLQNIIERAVEEKIAAWLKEQVELEEKEVSTEEFNKLFEQ